MWTLFKRPPVAAEKQPNPVAAEACPTRPCSGCAYPMPIASFAQACPRCRTRMPGALTCAGGCSGCELGSDA